VTEHGAQFKRGIHADPNFRRWLAWPKIILNNCKKDGIRDNLQENALVPFNDSLVYAYSFIACLVFSTVNLENHMEASGDPSETKSEISRTNVLRNIINCSWAEIDITYQ
jgi:hypothetical protein